MLRSKDIDSVPYCHYLFFKKKKRIRINSFYSIRIKKKVATGLEAWF
jgi:hypothetical protein